MKIAVENASEEYNTKMQNNIQDLKDFVGREINDSIKAFSK